MTFKFDRPNNDFDSITLEEVLQLNKYLNDNKTKWTAKELLERTKFCQAWNMSSCIAEVAAKTNIRADLVAAKANKYQSEGFKLIEFDPDATYQRTTYIPTPTQIAEEVRKIQSTWSDHAENARRRCDWRSKPVEYTEQSTQVNRKLPKSGSTE